ncbi:MAG: alanyl-tRNA synthetase [Candidatus Saganbacteria bacterium]|uniref:Alanine--tRNA ligase n=1 Tax=Candidatus Saganbacteria bacterium TaxID=2575572 RepID=A0A833NXS7_UNCSA|nr:MAG: alanyl-tRNA synthetase [Candidatus Saganbacteria bacterium]
MKSGQIRKTFLDYFEKQNHKILPSASLVPEDPTVLLTLAGMLPFKPIFLGDVKPKYKRAATIQKCIRMNDIENVGQTSRHHTFFEMLGNFSFGDYFKKEAIDFAWKLLTKVFDIPQDKLKIAVYEKDDEAFNIWNQSFNVGKENIFRLDEENNFWAAGPVGPCGPCSEIYYDFGREKGCGRPNCSPGCECERFLEIWNLVFIEFNRDANGKLNTLPAKNIDTGMGLERIARVLQNADSNFGTDLFMPILGMMPEGNEISRRIIADHIRAAVYLIADGVIPGNEGRGYVLKRIIRRMVLHGQKIKGIFLPKIAETAIELGKNTYPEISNNSKKIHDILKNEQENFLLTLESGMKMLNQLLKKKAISGEEAFKLHDTYGFPIELTKEIAKGIRIDEAGFNAAMETQRSRSRSIKTIETSKKYDNYQPTKFIGYDKNECSAKIIGIEEDMIILEKSPFYPESGGQVGDTGIIYVNDKEMLVIDTLGEINGVLLHKVISTEGFSVKQSVNVKINSSRRENTAMHHTATHLLHAGLRNILSVDAKQSGSFVGPNHLRFDFSWHKPLTTEEIEKIEKFVNDNIIKEIKVETAETSIESAMKMGVIALFGDKYGKKVRVVKINGVSSELCGGCHVKNTKDIQFFKITKEEALQSGVRRIEAIAGSFAKIYVVYQGKKIKDEIIKLMKTNSELSAGYEKLGGLAKLETRIFEIDQEELIRIGRSVDAKDIISVNKFMSHLKGRVDWLIERNKKLEKEIEKIIEKNAIKDIEEIAKKAKEIKGIKVIAEELTNVSMSNLRIIGDLLKNQGIGVIILAANINGKISIFASVSNDLTGKYSATDFIKVISEIIGSKGGGKKQRAEAGGGNPAMLEQALSKALETL